MVFLSVYITDKQIKNNNKEQDKTKENGFVQNNQ